MLNKKAESEGGLEDNMLGLVLALVIFIILILGAYYALTTIRSDTELERIQGMVDKLSSRIEALETGQSTNLTLQSFRSDSGTWYIRGWSKNSAGRPDRCFRENCLCICDGSNAASCDSRGICRTLDIGVIIENYYYTPMPFPIETEPITGSEPAIPLPDNLIVLELTKTADSVRIRHYSSEYLEYKSRT